MRPSLKLVLLVSTVAGASVLAATTASARYHGYDDRSRAVSYSRETGGYCDNAGCPDHFWKYPIHYGAVFADGQWYRGPVYYRGDRYGREYWVNGGWHRDEWRGHRPSWARNAHDGPALAFEFYADHGFRVGDHWRHEHDGDNNWNNGDNHDHGDRGDHGDQGDRYNGNGADNRDTSGGDHRGPNNNGGDWHASNNAQMPAGNDQHGGRDQNGQPAAGNVIRVTAATYGGATCHQTTGNVTKFVADSCNGKGTCDYVVRYQTIGDPSPGCAKDFAVQWTCSLGQGGSAVLPAEAGLGSTVTLQCAANGH